MNHVLLVEPDKNTAGIIQEFLEQDKSIKVHIAHSSQEGIHEADEQSPDLVIVELAIPHHNGFAFLHEFRSYNDWSNVPVIVHSHIDVNEAELSQEWSRLGAVAYFYKPTTTLKKLAAAVTDTLES